MDTARLEQLGLRVEEGSAGAQVTLALGEDASLENPTTHQRLTSVTFRLAEEQLVPAAPPAVVGLAPILLNAVQSREDIVLLLTGAFDEYLFHLERRSAQLNALGLHPSVEPESLALSAELHAGPLSFTLMADRQGNFRVEEARREGQPLAGVTPRFELSEFREREALASYLTALAEEAHAPPPASAAQGMGPVRYAELVEAFGAQALLPPRSPLELLVQLSVHGVPYRFAAARMVGRTFRGMLAGAKGKLWAERFELDGFPGVVRLVADILQVPPEAVKLTGSGSPQE